VLRFGNQLVVVIENKIVPHALRDQATALQLPGVEVQQSKVIGLGWHELLEDWWALLERGLLQGLNCQDSHVGCLLGVSW
jgi:hypothetical protein